MSGFILAAYGIFLALISLLAISLLAARRRVKAKLLALETALKTDAV